MDNGGACARRARALAPLADDGRFKSLLAAASGDHAYQALVRAVATRTKGADLGAYAKELDSMELIGEDEDEQLVALNDRLVVPESWGNHNSTMPSWKGSCRIRTIHPLSRTQAKMPKAETIEAE